MFEYINSGAIIINTLMAFVLLMVVILEKARNVGSIFMLLIWLIISFYLMYDTNKTANNNISQFKAGHNLICNSGFNTTYSVSLKENWKLKDHYFIKNSFMIKVNKCEEK